MVNVGVSYAELALEYKTLTRARFANYHQFNSAVYLGCITDAANNVIWVNNSRPLP